MSSRRQNSVSRTYIQETQRAWLCGRGMLSDHTSSGPCMRSVGGGRSLWAGPIEQQQQPADMEPRKERTISTPGRLRPVSLHVHGMGWSKRPRTCRPPATAAILRWLPVPRIPGRRMRRERACRPRIRIAHHTPAASCTFSSNH